MESLGLTGSDGASVPDTVEVGAKEEAARSADAGASLACVRFWNLCEILNLCKISNLGLGVGE